MAIRTPDWVKHAVFYQIFPDRFARSLRSPLPPGIQLRPWGSPPEQQGFQGGDLRGIVDKLDYVRDLGVTALYLTPIFASASNHRYHPYDYHQVDPLLGGNAALRELLDEAHGCGMRVVLDGVFNHASRGFWAFHHILENGVNSPYLDWFIIWGWPLRAYSSDAAQPPNYDCWWGLPALPKFNIRNPGVREYLLEVARHWIAFGIDGWRLDVPTEIDDERFWQAFRQVVKGANPEAYLCGEIWHPAEPWLQGDQFDAVMNYPFSRTVLGFCGARTLVKGYRQGGYPLAPLTAGSFARQLDELYGRYDWQVNYAQLNLLDSHDTARALWIMGDDQRALRLCVLLQMTLPGVPCIYYGDEIGMSAAQDPFCRAAFPWQDPRQWNHDLLTFYRRAIALRHHTPALRTGSFQRLRATSGIYAFVRILAQQCAVVIVNTQTRAVTLDIDLSGLVPSETIVEDVWHHGRYAVRQQRLHGVSIPARDAVVLVSVEDGTMR
ncbi:MAG TPA: glycoside hydrolase family 13 protein [Candidatus Tectomicrobia bacterium]|nr:glycoside hydrolase family 13 protein [Candidatus Tectomicrobia bacterium]